jgi:hypothetical protein
VGRGLLFLFFGSRALPFQFRQSLVAHFLIVCMEYGYEVFVRDSSYCLLFIILSLGLIGICISDWRLVEHKGTAASLMSI